jgi:hypothetical protein
LADAAHRVVNREQSSGIGPIDVVGLGLFAWALVYPEPRLLCLAALFAAPLVAIGALLWLRRPPSRGIGTRGMGVASLIMFPTMGLFARAFSDLTVLEWWPIVALGCGVGLVFAFAVTWVTRVATADAYAPHRADATGVRVLSVAVALPYGIATAIFVNVMLPQSPPRRIVAEVVDVQLVGFRPRSYRVDIAPLVGEERLRTIYA